MACSMTTQVRVKSSNPHSKIDKPPTVGYTIGGFFARFVIYNCIVTAILLPVYASNSFKFTDLFGNASKAKSAEAKQIVGAVNRSQQAYFLDKTHFSNTLADLKIGVASETKNYQYEVWVPPQNGPMQASEPNTLPIGAIVTARSKNPSLPSLSGVVSLVPEPGDKIKMRMVTGMCITSTPSTTSPILPRLRLKKQFEGQQDLSPSNMITVCPSGSKSLR